MITMLINVNSYLIFNKIKILTTILNLKLQHSLIIELLRFDFESDRYKQTKEV